LINYGLAHLDDRVTGDYFAVSLPDFLVFDAEHFDRVLALNASDLGATIHKADAL
jgi:hypothetical protein